MSITRPVFPYTGFYELLPLITRRKKRNSKCELSQRFNTFMSVLNTPETNSVNVKTNTRVTP